MRCRMRFKIARYGRVDCLVAAALLFGAGAATAALAPRLGPEWLAWTGALPVALAGFVVSFYRDPDRAVPAGAGLFVSPADGTVTDVATVDEPDYLGGKALRIGIFLSPLDVHVNRSPVAGTVEAVVRRAGRCLPATSPRCIDANASCLLGIRGEDGGRVAVRQVTGALARRIVCEAAVGSTLGRGERYGMIKLGSRTELLVPAGAGFEPAVKVGDVVVGGETVLGKLARVEEVRS